MLCYQDNSDGYTQLVRFTEGEHFIEIKENLDNRISLGLQSKVLLLMDIKA
ncbi:MAG: hypothetical protein ABIN94_16920 [Ferruginibacter sp.]